MLNLNAKSYTSLAKAHFAPKTVLTLHLTAFSFQITYTYFIRVDISKHPVNTSVQNGKHYMNASSVLCFCMFGVMVLHCHLMDVKYYHIMFLGVLK